MSEVTELQLQEQENLKAIHLKDIIEKLEGTKAFKELVHYYCVEYCAQLMTLTGESKLSDRVREDCLEQAKACGHFNRFLQVEKAKGYQAESDMEELKTHIQSAEEEDDLNA